MTQMRGPPSYVYVATHLPLLFNVSKIKVFPIPKYKFLLGFHSNAMAILLEKSERERERGTGKHTRENERG
jgi:hypothetical protein